jgi:Protein of unknown function (DUF1161)
MKCCIALKTALTAVLLHALPCTAITCEELRSEVEAKIRAGGVLQFTVTVMDANTPTLEKIVGSCDRGSKKLVYRQTENTLHGTQKPASPGVPAAQPPRQEDPIPTECKDGSISMTGVCKKS